MLWLWHYLQPNWRFSDWHKTIGRDIGAGVQKINSIGMGGCENLYTYHNWKFLSPWVCDNGVKTNGHPWWVKIGLGKLNMPLGKLNQNRINKEGIFLGKYVKILVSVNLLINMSKCYLISFMTDIFICHFDSTGSFTHGGLNRLHCIFADNIFKCTFSR